METEIQDATTCPIAKDARVVIVGAGCFGLSTAYHLLSRGYSDVTILDRSPILPAPDAASNDLNRNSENRLLTSDLPGLASTFAVVRSSYADKFYAELAHEAISLWKKNDIWGDSYHESGVIVLGMSNSGSANTTYADDSYKNDIALGCKVEILKGEEAIRACFPLRMRSTAISFDECAGYINRDGGWTDAGKGLTMLLKQVTTLNGKVVRGKRVVKLLRREEDHPSRTITCIECHDGTVLDAELVVIATGSWTPSAFPELGLAKICLSTGQCMAMMQLSQTEADFYRGCPVVLDFNSGFYVFPPNENSVVKMALHSAGYTHFANDISTPRTVTSDPETGLLIPKGKLHDLRRHLRKVYPDLAEKPFSSTRLCWYNDTPDADWIIGRHPENPSIILATGGSGHAFKFLPVIGRLVADAVENKLSIDLVDKFSGNRQFTPSDYSRKNQTAVQLDLSQLCAPEDLLP